MKNKNISSPKQTSKTCCAGKHVHEGPSFLQKLFKAGNDYKPLILILLFSFLMALIQNRFAEQMSTAIMHSFMGFFFIFLSLFKFFNIKAFVEGFSTYDLITKYFRPYGYMYPFIEFFLGIAYLAHFQIIILDTITVVVMLVSGAGVLNSVLRGQKIKCACLGTTLNVPLSTVSILENLGMGIMAAYSLANYVF
jgi:hypothetical protein